MAPKRFKKSDTNEENDEKYKNLIISDVLCPICRSIFIEPVTLPCNHGFCLACFNGTMENTALTCPLCRIRIGSWLRSARKENRIINGVLWGVIKLRFSKEINDKLKGEDVHHEEKVSIKLANPGEIRREYEVQLEKEKSEIQKEREAEAKASEIVIKKLLEEEEHAAKIAEENLRQDEEIARRLSLETNKSGPSSSQIRKPTPKKTSIDRYLIALSKKKQEPETSKCKPETVVSCEKETAEQAAANKSASKSYSSTIMCQSRKQPCFNAYKNLLLTKTLQCERATSNGSDSGDSIKQEMRYFKPIRLAPKSTTKLQGSGSSTRTPLLKLPTVHARSSTAVIRSPEVSQPVLIGSNPRSAFVTFPRLPPPCLVSPTKQPSIISESGKVIKQYYNKRRYFLTSTQPSTITSEESAFLGFEHQPVESRHVIIMKELITLISDNLRTLLRDSLPGRTQSTRNITGKTSLRESPVAKYLKSSNCEKLHLVKLPEEKRKEPPTKLVLKSHLEDPHLEKLHQEKQQRPNLRNAVSRKEATKSAVVSKRRLQEKSPKKLNGCDHNSGSEINLQEQLDLEFARRLHEELNNPRFRHTRASVQKKPMVKTRSSPRKRQVTLDELIPPKKFKI